MRQQLLSCTTSAWTEEAADDFFVTSEEQLKHDVLIISRSWNENLKKWELMLMDGRLWINLDIKI